MSEKKQKQPKTCLNDISQRDLAMVGVGPLTNTLLQIYCWGRFERIFKIAQHLATLWGKADCLKRPVRRGTVLLTDEKTLLKCT